MTSIESESDQILTTAEIGRLRELLEEGAHVVMSRSETVLTSPPTSNDVEPQAA